MGSFTIERDAPTAVVICRVEGFLNDEEALRLAQDWRTALISARRADSTLRLLFDNSRGGVASPKSAKAMGDATRDLWREGDRVAVLTPNSLAKVQAKRTMTTGGQVFISEKAARMWLSA